jgi:hypothetical protein
MVINERDTRIPVSCWLGLYILADRALLPTTCKTEAGTFRDCDPHLEIDYSDRAALRAALQKALLAGNPEISKPTKEQRQKLAPTAVAAKAQSWSELERKSIFFGIRQYPTEIIVEAWAKNSDGSWSENKSFEVSIAIEAGVDGVVDAILQHLSTRKDLPGMTFDFRQPKTARGA